MAKIVLAAYFLPPIDDSTVGRETFVLILSPTHSAIQASTKREQKRIRYSSRALMRSIYKNVISPEQQ
jgi:hypothetical protein